MVKTVKRSLIVATGAKGTGKTTFLSTYLPPDDLERCYYVDTEYSANNVVAQLAEHGLKFGRYVNVQDRFVDLPGEKDLLARIAGGNLPWVTRTQKNALADFYQWLVAHCLLVVDSHHSCNRRPYPPHKLFFHYHS